MGVIHIPEHSAHLSRFRERLDWIHVVTCDHVRVIRTLSFPLANGSQVFVQTFPRLWFLVMFIILVNCILFLTTRHDFCSI